MYIKNKNNYLSKLFYLIDALFSYNYLITKDNFTFSYI